MTQKSYKEFSTHKLFYMINHYKKEIASLQKQINDHEREYEPIIGRIGLIKLKSEYQSILNILSPLAINVAEINEERDKKIDELWDILYFKYQIENGIIND